MPMNAQSLPVQTDTALADLYNAAQAAQDKIATFAMSALQQAGADFYYRGRRRVTDMKVSEAEAILADELAKLAAWRETHSTTEADGYVSTDWRGYVGRVQPHSIRNAERALSGLAEHRAEVRRLRAEMETLEEVYTAEGGWSRFFVVTSSAGHIHSSMSCSTCRPTTTYGWLPQLSGRTEAEAVEAHGPALCSVCFPSAPVETVGGKLTKSQAAKAAH